MAATSRTESYDALLTTTARFMEPTIRDNITKSNKLVAWLNSKGNMRPVSGGERIQIPLMYELNTGADIYDGYSQLDTTPQDGHTSAFFAWSQMAVPISISGKERRQNNSRQATINLLQAKIKQAQASAMQLQEHCIVSGKISSGASGDENQFVARTGRLDTSASGPLPLPAIVDADEDRSVSIGDINGSTETWWQNQSLDAVSSVTDFASYKKEKLRLYMQCTRGVGGHPDLIISDERTYIVYWASLETNERYIVDNPRVIDILGGAGDDMLKFRGAIHIWTEDVPDVGSDTADNVDGIGSYLADGNNGTEYHLNTDFLEYIFHPEANWTMTPFVTPVNQDATTAHLLWMGATTVSNRRKQGVMHDILNTISS